MLMRKVLLIMLFLSLFLGLTTQQLVLAQQKPLFFSQEQKQSKQQTKKNKTQQKKAETTVNKQEEPLLNKTEPPKTEPPKTEIPKNQHQWALLIGISDYPGQIQDLLFAKQDVLDIRKTLIDSAGFQNDHIFLLTDNDKDGLKATKQNIFSVLEQELTPKVQKEDEIIVFLAGHGFSTGLGNQAKSYFLPLDVDAQSKEMLEKTAINLNEFSSKLSLLKAKQFTIFVDACREDPFPGRGIKGNPLTDVMARGLRVKPIQAEVVTTVTFYSCQIGERAYESDELGHGIFTYFILSGIKELASRPDGRIEAGLLANYLKENVRNWAREFQARARYAIEQTPTMIANEIHEPVIILRVASATQVDLSASGNGEILVSTSPDNVNIFINGQLLGKGPIKKEFPPGQYKIRAEMAGFQPTETSVNVIAGYDQELSLNLKPTTSSASYEKAVQFQAQGLEPQAIFAFEQAIKEDSSLVAAYERLATIYLKLGRYRDAVDLLMLATQKFSDNAMVIAQYSRALSVWAEKDEKKDISSNARPSKAIKHSDARKEAIKAAELAIGKASNLAAPQIALGFAYLIDEKDRSKAIPVFIRASVMTPDDAEAYYGAGYGYRLLKKYQDAITQLNKAISLRSDYYEAQRELAYCHHALGDTDQAIQHYENATSYRTQTNNSSEMAGNNLALSTLYQQKGQETGGTRGNSYIQAGKGYEKDAREYDPTLKAAFEVLSQAGLSSRIKNFLPSDLNNVLDKLKMTDKIKIPFP